MDLVNELREISIADRMLDLERRQDGYEIKGDFEGSVTGAWIRLDPSGAGVVNYKSKEYYTKMIGFTSLPRGTLVELSFANGTYISKY